MFSQVCVYVLTGTLIQWFLHTIAPLLNWGLHTVTPAQCSGLQDGNAAVSIIPFVTQEGDREKGCF